MLCPWLVKHDQATAVAIVVGNGVLGHAIVCDTNGIYVLWRLASPSQELRILGVMGSEGRQEFHLAAANLQVGAACQRSPLGTLCQRKPLRRVWADISQWELGSFDRKVWVDLGPTGSDRLYAIHLPGKARPFFAKRTPTS